MRKLILALTVLFAIVSTSTVIAEDAPAVATTTLTGTVTAVANEAGDVTAYVLTVDGEQIALVGKKAELKKVVDQATAVTGVLVEKDGAKTLKVTKVGADDAAAEGAEAGAAVAE